jgi:hypothetical protein
MCTFIHERMEETKRGNDPVAGSRIEWLGYDVESSKENGLESISVKVHLLYKGKNSRGEATGPRAPRNLLRLVATATLDAVRQLFPDQGTWFVEDVVPATSGENTYLIVFLNLLSPRGNQKFIGTAFIRDDTQKAVGIATLNAINRFLGHA